MESLSSDRSFESFADDIDEKQQNPYLPSILAERLSGSQSDLPMFSNRFSLVRHRSMKLSREKDMELSPSPEERHTLFSKRLSTLGSKIKYLSFRSPKDESQVLTKTSDPCNEEVLRSYSCALSVRILLQGRIYITKSTIGFISVFNDTTLFGLEPTMFVIAFQDILAIRKRTIALFFRNSIEIETNDNKIYVLASFLARDKVFGFLVNLWKECHALNEEKSEMGRHGGALYEGDEQEITKLGKGVICSTVDTDKMGHPKGQRLSHPLSKILNGSEILEESTLLSIPSYARGSLPEVSQSCLETIVCPNAEPSFPSQRLKNIDSSIFLPVSLDIVFNEIFFKDAFFKRFLDTCGMKDIHIKPWGHQESLDVLQRIWMHRHGSKTEKEGHDDEPHLSNSHRQATHRPKRQILYEQPLEIPASLGVFFSSVTSSTIQENWTLFVYSLKCIVVESVITIIGVPFSNSFYVIIRYRLTETDENITRLDMEFEVFWHRWIILKKRIEDEISQKTKENYAKFSQACVEQLQTLGRHGASLSTHRVSHTNSFLKSPPKNSFPPKYPPEQSKAKCYFLSLWISKILRIKWIYMVMFFFLCHFIFVSLYVFHLLHRLHLIERTLSDD